MWMIIGFCKQHLLWIFLLNYTHFAVYMVFKSQRKKNEIKFQIVGNMQEALETQKQNRMRKYGWRIIILYGIREMKSQIKMHLNWIYWQAAISMALNVMGLMFLICLSSFRVFFFYSVFRLLFSMSFESKYTSKCTTTKLNIFFLFVSIYFYRMNVSGPTSTVLTICGSDFT